METQEEEESRRPGTPSLEQEAEEAREREGEGMTCAVGMEPALPLLLPMPLLLPLPPQPTLGPTMPPQLLRGWKESVVLELEWSAEGGREREERKERRTILL